MTGWDVAITMDDQHTVIRSFPTEIEAGAELARIVAAINNEEALMIPCKNGEVLVFNGRMIRSAFKRAAMKKRIKEEREMMKKTERVEWSVYVYTLREDCLTVRETYGTREEAEHRLDVIETAMRHGGIVRCVIPELDSVTIVSGSMIVGAKMFRRRDPLMSLMEVEE